MIWVWKSDKILLVSSSALARFWIVATSHVLWQCSPDVLWKFDENFRPNLDYISCTTIFLQKLSSLAWEERCRHGPWPHLQRHSSYSSEGPHRFVVPQERVYAIRLSYHRRDNRRPWSHWIYALQNTSKACLEVGWPCEKTLFKQAVACAIHSDAVNRDEIRNLGNVCVHLQYTQF